MLDKIKKNLILSCLLGAWGICIIFAIVLKARLLVLLAPVILIVAIIFLTIKFFRVSNSGDTEK